MVLTCVCGQSFRDKTDLNRHQNRKISCLIVKITSFKCESCNTYFSSVSNLNKHMKKHKNVCLSNSLVEFTSILPPEEVRLEKEISNDVPLKVEEFVETCTNNEEEKIRENTRDIAEIRKEPQIEEILEPIQEFYLEDIVVGMTNKDYKWYANLKIDNL